MDIALVLNGLIAGRDYILLALWIIATLNGSAKGAIAAVNELVQTGTTLSDEEALQKASDLMGKYIPYIPEFVRKWIIQQAFNSMKKATKTVK